MTKTRVYLCWYSKNTIDFCHLSELAGIQPTKITKKGTPVVSHKDGSLVPLSANKDILVKQI